MVINTGRRPAQGTSGRDLPDAARSCLAINLKVTNQVAEGIKSSARTPRSSRSRIRSTPSSTRLQQRLHPPKNKIVGMAGVLDSGRYCYFVAEAANVWVENVNAMVLGGHGDDMVPVRSSCRIAGIPVEQVPERGEAQGDRDPHAQGGRRGGGSARLWLGVCLAGVGRARDGRGHDLRQAQDPACAPTSRASTA